MIACNVSGCSETKSHNVSCAEAACGISLCGSRFHRVNEVGKLNAVLDEEHRKVVADQVVVTLLGVELGREAAHIANGVGGSRDPATVENRTNTGVSTPGVVRNFATVYSASESS